MTTLVLGLDGASFELIGSWIDDGSLPTISRLVEEGASSDLQSCVPPVTCPNWQAYATGTNPGKLGVFWWEHINREKQTITNASSAENFDGKHFWTHLDGQSAIVNLPTSYPPPEIDGVHVAGGPGADQSGYTHPPEFESMLRDRYNYQIHPERLGELSGEDTDSECIEEIYDLIDMRFDLVDDLLEEGEYELVHATVFYINVLHHFFWDDEVVKEAWKRIDRRLAETLETGEVDTLFVMSDHGSNEIEVSFRINSWLESEGYLETTRGLGDVLYKLGLTRERVRPLLASAGIEWLLRTVLPSRIQNALPDKSGSITQSAKASVVNWDASRAIASGQGPVYILSDHEEEQKQIKSELVDKLSGLTHIGQEVISTASDATDVYEGPYVEQGPDLVLRQAPGVHIEGKIGNVDPFGKPSRWRGENKETGLFIAHGPDVESEAQLTDMRITEIAPTILHLHGKPIPGRMDQGPRIELFKEGSDPAERDAKIDQTTRKQDANNQEIDEEGDVSQRLSDLGYLE
jgi:predicted AlkP superfamily phosphohydrolase/phosphomutase